MMYMKQSNKFGLTFVITLVVCSVITPFSIAVTIGNSSFYVESGATLVWRATSASINCPYKDGDKVNVSISAVGLGKNQTIDVLEVNATMGFYNSTTGKWVETFSAPSDGPFLRYNASMHFLYVGNPYIVPIPLNMTLLNETINSYGSVTAAFSGSTINITYGDHVSSYTYNANGICTSILEKTSTWQVTWELETSYTNIPFGNYFLLIMTISVVVLAFIIKKRNVIVE